MIKGGYAMKCWRIFRKEIAFAVAGCLMLSTFSAIPNFTANAASGTCTLITEENFENATDLFNSTVFWSDNSTAVETQNIISGSKSMRVSNTAIDWRNLMGTSANEISFTAGQTYSVVFKFKSLSTVPFIQFVVQSMDTYQDYAYVRFNTQTLAVDDINAGAGAFSAVDAGDYKQIRFTFTAQGSNSWVRWQTGMQNGNNIDVLLDDIQFYNGAAYPLGLPSPNVKSVYDENFDNAASLWNDTMFWEDATCSFITDNAISGAQSVQFISAASDNKNLLNLSTDKLAIGGGKTYTVMFKYRVNSAMQGLQFHVEEANTWVNYLNIQWDPQTGAVTKPDGCSFDFTDYLDYKMVKIVFTSNMDNKSYFMVKAINATENINVVFDDVKIYEGVYTGDMPLPVSTNKKVLAEGFETAQNLANDTAFWSPAQSALVNHGTSVINGSGDFHIQNSAGDWQILFGSSVSKLSFLSGRKYTVSLKYKANTSIPFLMFGVKDSITDQYTNYYRWNTQTFAADDAKDITLQHVHTDAYEYVSFTFTASSGSSYLLLQAGQNQVEAVDLAIDDIMIYDGDVQSFDVPGSAIAKAAYENFEQSTGVISKFQMSGTINRPYVAGLTFESAEVIDGAMSLKAGYNYPSEGSEWGAFFTVTTSDVPIDPATSYTIKFRYKILQNPATRFYLMLDSSTNSNDAYLGFNQNGADLTFAQGVTAYSFVDEGNGVMVATITLTSKDAKDYNSIVFGSTGGGFVSIDDFGVYKGCYAETYSASQKSAPVANVFAAEDFESNSDGNFFWTNNQQNFGGDISYSSNSVINGRFSYVQHSSTGWAEPLNYDYFGGRLAANTKYTVAFRYKAVDVDDSSKNTADTRYYIVAHSDTLGNGADQYQAFTPDGQAVLNIPTGQWYNGIENFVVNNSGLGYYDAYFTFQTGNADDTMFKFGIMNKGGYSLDDIRICTGAVCNKLSDGKVIPVDNGSSSQLVAQENFENGNFNYFKKMYSQDMGRMVGDITLLNNEVINGTNSVRGAIQYPYLGQNGKGEWFEFMESDSSKLPLEAYTVYTVTYRYKVMASPADGGCFAFYLKNSASSIADQYVGFNADGTINSSFRQGIISCNFNFEPDNSGYKTAVITLLSGNRADYRFVFGLHNGGDIIIDDLMVFKGSSPSVSMPIIYHPSAPAEIASTDFEDGLNGFKSTLSGCRTSASGEVLNGSWSFVGSTQNEWYEYLKTDANQTKLEPNTTYTLSFRYKPIAKDANTRFTIIAKRTAEQYDNNSTDLFAGISGDGRMVWYSDDNYADNDYSMVPEWRTVAQSDGSYCGYLTFKTKNYSDYIVCLGINNFDQPNNLVINGGKIVVDDVNLYKGFDAAEYGSAQIVPVETTALISDDFNNGIDSSNYYLPVNSDNIQVGKIVPDSDINGTAAVKATSDLEWAEYLSLDTRKIKLQPNEQYVLRFAYKITSPVNGAGCFDVIVKNSAIDPSQHVFFGFTAPGMTIDNLVGIQASNFYTLDGVNYCEITFQNMNSKNSYIVFGIHNEKAGGTAASISIDDISLMSYKGYVDLKGKSSTENFDFNKAYLKGIVNGTGSADELGEGKTIEVVKNDVVGKETAETAIDWSKEDGGAKAADIITTISNKNILPWVIEGTALILAAAGLILLLVLRKKRLHKKEALTHEH